MLDRSRLSQSQQGNLSTEEIARFDALAESWWDPHGKYRTALAFNATRTQFMLDGIACHHQRDSRQANCLQGLSILDIGCGGGLISEAMAQRGASVTGIDASGQSIEVAKRHAQKSGLSIDYRHELASTTAQRGERFDVVINAEVVEHVPDQKTLLTQSAALVAPHGSLIVATLNRTVKSWLVAIVGAEYLLRYLPIGTHDWRCFVKPDELGQWLAPLGFYAIEQAGMALNPIVGKWRLSDNMQVNYVQLYRRK